MRPGLYIVRDVTGLEAGATQFPCIYNTYFDPK